MLCIHLRYFLEFVPLAKNFTVKILGKKDFGRKNKPGRKPGNYRKGKTASEDTETTSVAAASPNSATPSPKITSEARDSSTNSRTQHACPQCEMTFTFQHQLERHVSAHEAGARYKCSMCPDLFESSSGFRVHLVKFHKLSTDEAKLLVELM